MALRPALMTELTLATRLRALRDGSFSIPFIIVRKDRDGIYPLIGRNAPEERDRDPAPLLAMPTGRRR
jgi:hypothetical protein